MTAKKIVTIGGGTGVFTVLSGLKNHLNVDLSAVVTMADDGGSTGILREEFGILPPGDVRRALVALSTSDNKVLSDLFNYRFSEGAGLRGHSFGNLMLTALERVTGNFPRAIEEASKILSVKGRVVPVTLQKPRLFAELENGTIIKGETNINIPNHDGRLKIKKLWLDPPAKINPVAKEIIMNADAVIIGPGDLYTSVMPNLVVEGVCCAIKKTKAKKIYVTNLMTKFGETNNYKTEDFIAAINKVLGKEILDYAIINNKKPTPNRLKKYAEEKAMFVSWDALPAKPLPVIGDYLRPQGFIRHDPEKLANTIMSLI